MHRVDEVRIDLDRHLGHVEGRLERRIVAARVGEELELLELRVQRGGVGIAELARALVVALKAFSRSVRSALISMGTNVPSVSVWTSPFASVTSG